MHLRIVVVVARAGPPPARLPAGERTVWRRDIAAAARDLAGPALAAGIEPASPQADPIVAEYTARSGPDADGLPARLERANGPGWVRYLELLAVINGRPAPEGLGPALDRSVAALRVRG